MKVAHYSQYGSTEVLQLVDIPQPEPKNNEILLRTHAASINSYDYRIMTGKPILVRLAGGLFKPKGFRIPGADVAGVVEAVGSDVQDFAVGDAVYGCLADGTGDSAFAEYACARADVFAHKPESISFAEAASLPMAAVTALQGLRDVGKIQAGQRVLINGATGGVGTFAVQIAKALGAEVTGVCSARNADLVRSIGADHVIDYAVEDFTAGSQKYDLILDVVANHSQPQVRQALEPGGTCAVVGFSTMSHAIKMILFAKQSLKRYGKKIEMVMADNTKSEDLYYLNTLLESGKIKPVIDACYPLDEIKEAFSYYEAEHPRGKIVLTMGAPIN